MSLADVPTKVEPCTAIFDWLGSDRVWMKRDDLISPLYGGNKVRRYEFLLADAKARGKARIVTVGGLASTQAMATTILGRAAGFDVTVVLFDQPMSHFAEQTIRGLVGEGAEVVHGGGYAATIWRTLRALGKGTYFIPPGAASPRANIGYIDAMLELGAQVENGEMPRPDVIVLPTGSSGTLAALALGAARLGWTKTEIIGVRITTALVTNRLVIGRVIKRTDAWLAKQSRHWQAGLETHWSIDGSALGKGYGYATPQAIEGAAQVEKLTGAKGEITYSGKALAALREITRARPYATVLLWNTLSTPRATRLASELREPLDRLLQTHAGLKSQTGGF